MTEARRGRKRLFKSTLRPDGMTPEMYEILRVLAKGLRCSVAELERDMIAKELKKAGYTDEDLGFINDETETG